MLYTRHTHRADPQQRSVVRFTRTGYGMQCAQLSLRLVSAGYTVAISAFYGLAGASTNWNGILVLPAGQDAYGSDILLEHAKHVGADLVLTLMDMWVLDRAQLRAIRDAGIVVASWLPVDADPLGVMDAQALRETGVIPVAMSRYGHGKLIEAGFSSALFAPHAIDMSVFKPAENREDLRREFNLENRWVLGINKSNKDQVRSAYPEQLAAFARLHERHPDTILSIHSARVTPTGLNLDDLAAKLGITDAVAFNNQYAYVAGLFSQSALADWYSALDLCSNTAYGGGFELALLEAQACGTPVVGTDHSAMSELCKVGWKVRGEPVWNPSHQAWWAKPSIDAIYKVYERAYADWKSGAISKKRKAARAFAEAYDADVVLRKYWAPVLRELESERHRMLTIGRDRDAAVERLSRAWSDGKLDGDQFGDRAQRALTAMRADDLIPLVADLPEEMAA